MLGQDKINIDWFIWLSLIVNDKYVRHVFHCTIVFTGSKGVEFFVVKYIDGLISQFFIIIFFKNHNFRFGLILKLLVIASSK